ADVVGDVALERRGDRRVVAIARTRQDRERDARRRGVDRRLPDLEQDGEQTVVVDVGKAEPPGLDPEAEGLPARVEQLDRLARIRTPAIERTLEAVHATGRVEAVDRSRVGPVDAVLEDVERMRA